MALRKRETILAGATGALLVTFAGVFLFRGGDSLGDLRKKRDQLETTKERQEAEARPGLKASQKLARWNERSLPADPKTAGALYNKWLLELAVDRVKLDKAVIQPSPARSQGGYSILPFSVKGAGTLEQLTRFLFAFYSVDYLHKVRLLTFNPIPDSRELKLTIDIEALCLPGAKSQNKLPDGKPKRLQYAELNDYLKTIVRRQMEGDRYAESGGLFAAYVPPPPKVEPVLVGPKPKQNVFDPSAYTFVSAINEVHGQPEVWLFDRTGGKTHVLHEGDPFEVGKMSGKIARIRIDQLEVEIEINGGQRLRINFGDNLHDGVKVPE
jgi:hypothetical protein